MYTLQVTLYSSVPEGKEFCLSLGLSPVGLIFRLSVDLGLEDRLSCDVCSSRLAFEDIIGT